MRSLDGLDGRASVAVPDDDHRLGAFVCSADPAPISTGTGAADRVAVALQQLLRPRIDVMDDCSVRGDVEDGGSVRVAQVLERHIAVEAEHPRERQHVRVGLRHANAGNRSTPLLCST